MDGQTINERKAALMAYAADIISSERRHNNTHAMLSEEVVEEIVKLAQSEINFENPEEFEKVKERLLNVISR